MPATVALALIAIVGGALLTYLYDRRASLAARMGTGACTGYALLGSVETFCTSVLHENRALIVTATVFILAFALLAIRQIRCQVLTDICATENQLRKAYRRPGWKEVRCIIFYGFLVMLLWRVFDRVLFESGEAKYSQPSGTTLVTFRFTCRSSPVLCMVTISHRRTPHTQVRVSLTLSSAMLLQRCSCDVGRRCAARC